jgi:predicted RNA-binding protein
MAGNHSEFLERIKTKRWDLYKRTSHRLNIRKEDKILFYLARYPRRKFVANAVLSSKVREEDEEFSVGLNKIKIWKRQIPIRPLIESLEFIKNKNKWGGYMQGGIVKITKKDFDKILKTEKE